MTPRAAALCTALLLACPALARAQSDASAEALARWTTAVTRHVPGQLDSDVRFVAGWRYSDRARLNPAMERFFRLFRGERPAIHSAAQRAIADLFQSMSLAPGIEAFLRRAAVLHADAAISINRVGPPPDDAPAPPLPRAGRRVDPPPPLLSNERYVRQTDGRVIDEVPGDWNWPFARSLLDLPGADRGFVGEWYHATDAYMMAVGDLGALKAQLAHVADRLPDDPRILFDRGCYAEAMGLPYNQVVRDDPDYSGKGGTGALVPSEADANSDAEKLFRRAVEVDGGYAEARVRLARLLERRGRHDEAAGQIEQALALNPPKVVSFLAQLVDGRVELSRGRPRDSLGHYRAALAIFPDAQSALIGASHAAVMASEVATAEEFLSRLGDRTSELEADPWWSYHYGAGRDVDGLLAAAWSRLSSK